MIRFQRTGEISRGKGAEATQWAKEVAEYIARNPERRGLVPPEHKNPDELYEEYQIAKLRKWAPVRTYHGNLNPNGERGHR